MLIPIVLASAVCALVPRYSGAPLGAAVSSAALTLLLLTKTEGLLCLGMACPSSSAPARSAAG